MSYLKMHNTKLTMYKERIMNIHHSKVKVKVEERLYKQLTL